MFPNALTPSASSNNFTWSDSNAYVVTVFAYLAPSTSPEACALDIFWITVIVLSEFTSTPFTVLNTTSLVEVNWIVAIL